MKNMNKYYLALLPAVLLLAMVMSCKKNFLDRQPLGRYVESDIPAGSFENKVFALYAGLRAFAINGNNFVGIENFRDDLSEKGSTIGDGAKAGRIYDHYEYDPSHGPFAAYWNKYFEVIIGANAIIHDIDSIGATDAQTLINKGEAQFLRAYSFFHLTRTFGEVPLIDFKIYDPADVNIPKSPVGEIYAQIKKDAEEAAAVLPQFWEEKYTGRLTSGAAYTLLTDFALWTHNYAGALGYAKMVIQSSQYDLVDDYRFQFTGEGENGLESIFEIQAYFTPTQHLGIQYAQVQGVRGAGEWNLGWGWNVPTQKLVDEFEDGDNRRAATILYSGQVEPYYNQRVPDYPAVIARPYWNMKIYTDPDIRDEKNDQAGHWMNQRIYRYAGLLLMAAEAAVQVGGDANIQDALGWIEKVRARAREGAGKLPKVTTTVPDSLMAAIRHERIVELGMENKRFYDLVRWGLGVQELGSMGYQPRNKYLPIPQSEIDKSSGVLVQNPDYQ